MKKDASSNKALQLFEQAKLTKARQLEVKGGNGTETPPPPPPPIGTDDLINGRG